MSIIKSNINLKSESFQKNQEENLKTINELKQKLTKVIHRPDDPSVIRHKQRGKLLARERIEKLLDESTPFLELSTLAAYDQYDNSFPSAGIIVGIGIIRGIKTVIIANDATVKGGTYVKETIKKHLRAQEISIQNLLPCVYLVDSGGIFLPEQAEVFADKENFGRIFYNQARMSAMQIPQIAIVMGSCTAGGAYIPAMSDETIIVQNQGTIFLAGPPLVKAATGEEISAEDLGGGLVHTSISGVADHLAANDEHAIQICRDIFGSLPLNNLQNTNSEFSEPLYNINDLSGIIESDLKNSTNHYEIIARLVDGSEFQEFKANYGKTIITVFAKIMGITVGIIANNGILFSEAAQKATHFIELCCYRKVPLIFLQDIAGFMVGKEYEHKGIIKDGAKMVQAVANANVPKITIITGKSYGAGNYAMAGRAYGSNFLFIWPNSRIAVMGGEQAANVLNNVQSKNGNNVINETLLSYEKSSSPYYSTSRLWDDGIIDPIETRKILAMCLSVALNKPIGNPEVGIYRM